jgi:ferric-dicitrate binding protein FerR (iron transport regulator)
LSNDRCSAHLDDELTPDERTAFEAELATSPQLRVELDEVRGVRTLVRRLPSLAAPSEVFDLDDDAAARGSGRGWRVVVGAAAISIAAAAAAAVVAVPDGSPAPVQPQVASLTDTHGEQSSTVGDPIFQLASETP